MKYEALGHRIMCRADVINNKTESGLFKPDQTVALERAGANKGVVVAIGATAWKAKDLGSIPWCEIGDRIIWPRYAGAIVEIEGVDYHFINDEDCLAREIADE